MGVLRRLRAEGFNELEVFWRVHQVVLAADHVGYLHLKVIDDVDKMEHVGAVAAFHDHVGRVRFIAVVDGNLAADEVVHGDRFAVEAETGCIAILVKSVGGEEFFEIGVVDGFPLGLVI